jgi:hypothetical protein
MKKVVIVASLLILGCYVFFTSANESEIFKDKYIKSLDLELKGVVKSVELSGSGHNTGRIYLDVIETNHLIYDVKYLSKHYLCKVETGKAELIVSSPNDYTVNDIVVVSSKKDSCFVYNQQNQLKNKWKLYLIDYWKPPMGTPIFFKK